MPSVGPSASSISFTLFFLSIKKKYFSAEGIRPCQPLETLRLHCRCSALPSAWRSTPRWPELRFNFNFQRWHPLPSAPGRLHLPESPGDIRGFPPRGTNHDLNRARACADSDRHFFWSPVRGEKRGNGQRGAGKKPRAQRRCKTCLEKLRGDEEARACAGRWPNSRACCPHASE